MARQRKIEPTTGLSRESLETLLDLVEIRLGCVEVYDREDARELKQLEKTREQLHGLLGIGSSAAAAGASKRVARAQALA